jgi:hypothetical protein
MLEFEAMLKHIEEDLFQLFYSFFSSSSKRHLEFLKLVDLMKAKGTIFCGM